MGLGAGAVIPSQAVAHSAPGSRLGHRPRSHPRNRGWRAKPWMTWNRALPDFFVCLRVTSWP